MIISEYKEPVIHISRLIPSFIDDQYTCESCGLAVTVDEGCCCVNPCDLVCCDLPMIKRWSKK